MKINKILIIANTYFQLITAVSLKLEILKKDCVDILITNRSTGAKEVFERIKESNLFNNCFFCGC